MSELQGHRSDLHTATLVSQYGSVARVPVRPAMIEYAAAPQQAKLATWKQFMLGLLYPVGYSVFAAVTLGIADELRQNAVFALLSLLHPAIFIATVIYVRIKLKWSGFLAGALTTVLGAPIVFFAACAVICAVAF